MENDSRNSAAISIYFSERSQTCSVKPAENTRAGLITAEFSAAVKTPGPQSSPSGFFWFVSALLYNTDELSIPLLEDKCIMLCLKHIEDLLILNATLTFCINLVNLNSSSVNG